MSDTDSGNATQPVVGNADAGVVKFEGRSCTCNKCVARCEKNPGWMTPSEAGAAIKAGHAAKLMCDWLEPDREVGNDERIFILCPASVGFEGRNAPEVDEMIGGGGGFLAFLSHNPPYKGRCVFLTAKNRCGLHRTKFKPLQCRDTYGCDATLGSDNYAIARLWQNAEAEAVVALWRKTIAAVGDRPTAPASGASA